MSLLRLLPESRSFLLNKTSLNASQFIVTSIVYQSLTLYNIQAAKPSRVISYGLSEDHPERITVNQADMEIMK